MSDATYRMVNRFTALVFRVAGFRFTLTGLQHIPPSGPAVLASNHTGFLDFVWVGYAARQRGRLVRFICKASMFDVPVAGWLLRRMGHIPVRRSSGALAYHRSLRALDAGELVGVFPEATISRSWLLRERFKPGAAAMASSRGVPLIPVVAWGGHRFFTVDGRRTWRRRIPITIAVGEPLEPVGTRAELDSRLRARMSTMLTEVLDAYPGITDTHDDPWWIPHDRGGTAPDPATAEILDAEAVARLGDSIE